MHNRSLGTQMHPRPLDLDGKSGSLSQIAYSNQWRPPDLIGYDHHRFDTRRLIPDLHKGLPATDNAYSAEQSREPRALVVGA